MSAVCAGAVLDPQGCLGGWSVSIGIYMNARLQGLHCRVYVNVGRLKFNYLTILVRAKNLKVSPMTAQELLCEGQVFMH